MISVPVILAALVIGQAEPASPFSLRLEVGPTWYSDIHDQSVDVGPYISIGGVYAIPLNDTLNLTVGADLGFREGDAEGSSTTSKIKMAGGQFGYSTTTAWEGEVETYSLMFNLGLVQTLGSTDHYGWFVEGGLQVGVAWNEGTLEGTVTHDYDGGSDSSFSLRESEANLAYGAFFGGGYAFTNNMALSLGVKYFDAGEVASFDVEGVNLYLGFGYGF
jgi:hypothetical protein